MSLVEPTHPVGIRADRVPSLVMEIAFGLLEEDNRRRPEALVVTTCASLPRHGHDSRVRLGVI